VNNYIKCKYSLNLTESDHDAIGVDLATVNFLCKPIGGKFGDFRVQRNGELCHNLIEYQSVDSSDAGKPGVIWNGTGYARVKSKTWDRVEFTGELEIETQIMAKNTDASLKVKFEFSNGYVVDHTCDVVLIDNASRLSHTENIKEQAINRAKRMNTRTYKVYKSCLINPLISICIYLRYPLIFCQELLMKLEQKLNKQL
jgi:hypothetical protein